MQGFPTLKQYLNKSERGKLTKQEILTLKQQYKKLYFKEYNRRRKKPITLTFRIDKKKYKRLQTAKADHNYRSLNQFILDSIFAHLDEGYVFPQEESKQQLINEINAIGTNINQVVHKLHMHSLRMNSASGTIELADENMSRILAGFKLLKEEVDQLKTTILTFIQTPQPSLLGISWNTLAQDEEKIQSLISYLQEHLSSL